MAVLDSLCKILSLGQGWIQEFFVGGSNLKKLEKTTSAAIGRAKIDDFSYVFMHILKKLEKNLEKIGKNLEKICPVGGDASPPLDPSLYQ